MIESRVQQLCFLDSPIDYADQEKFIQMSNQLKTGFLFF
jgi:hypothetical protein